jgi:hypothetical protein
VRANADRPVRPTETHSVRQPCSSRR